MKRLISIALLTLTAGWASAQQPTPPPLPDMVGDGAAQAEEPLDYGVSEDAILNEVMRELGNELDNWNEEDRQQLIAALENLQDMNIDMNAGPGEALIAVTAIILIFGMPIFVVGIVAYASYRKKRLVFQTLNQYAENGRDIPPEVTKLITAGSSREKSPLHTGLISTGVGLGLMVFGFISESEFMLGAGAIVLFIGLAYLLIWKLEKKPSQNTTIS